VHAFFALSMYVVRPQYWRHYCLLMFIFSIMEFEQAAQWFWGDVLPLENFIPVPTSCTKRNALLSFVGWLFLYLQPLAVSAGAYMSLDERRKYFVFPILYMTFSILMGIKHYDFDPTDAPTGVDVPNTNYGKYSCTYIGPKGHLLWKWAFNNLEHAPNFNSYAMTVIISVFLMPMFSTIQVITAMGYALTYTVGWIYMGWSEELPAFWCYVSVVAAIPCSIALVHHYVYGPKRDSKVEVKTNGTPKPKRKAN